MDANAKVAINTLRGSRRNEPLDGRLERRDEALWEALVNSRRHGLVLSGFGRDLGSEVRPFWWVSSNIETPPNWFRRR
jgi:hypothetical protein